MTSLTKKKRKPFGTRDGNALILRKTTSGIGGEKSKTKTTTTLRKQGEKKKVEEKKRPRNSKTPKTSNLTAAAGAYNLSKEFAAVGKGGKQKPSKKVVRGGQQQSTTTQRSSSTTALSKGRDNTHRSSTTLSKGRDPSPIKRPDPSSKDGHLKVKHHNSNSLLTKSSKERSSKHERAAVSRVKTSSGKDGFVAASLKRLFPSSKEVAKKEPTRSTRKPLDPSDDTVCTTPEQVSPLITSPLNKPDPPLNGKDDVHRAVKPVVKKSHGQPSKVERRSKQQSVLPQKNTNHQQSNKNSGILKEADNKRVLEAMLNSGPTNNNNREVDSVIGSIVGGASLQRSYSIDGSEVTALDDVENESQASMTTCGDRLSVPTHRHKHTNNVSDIFRTKVQQPQHEHDSKKINSHQELRRANSINSQTAESVNNTDQPIQHQQQPLPNTSTAIQLPSGWKTRWSKTKQKPYYVHPDFGATWHCPGLKSTTDNQHVDANAQRTASTQYQQVFRGETKNTNHKEDVPFESATALNANSSQGVAANLNLTTSANSSKCFTQDFESNDGALAPSSSVLNEDQSDEMEIAVQRAKQDEQHYNHSGDDSIEFDNNGGDFPEDTPKDDEDTPAEDDDTPEQDGLLHNSKKTHSPKPTIKELPPSAQSRQSSQISDDEEEVNALSSDHEDASQEQLKIGLDLLQKDSLDTYAFDELSNGDVEVEEEMKSRAKFFPPGPLCSLQFLEEIQNEEFDTPLWRRMKRKRSTLSEVQASKKWRK